MILYPCISNQSTGGWSTEGIIQDNDPTLPVLCSTTHLTSFCVLVSAEEFEVCYNIHCILHLYQICIKFKLMCSYNVDSCISLLVSY